MPAGPAKYIGTAREYVQRALQGWNAADLKRAETSRGLLEQSVAALKIAIDLLQNYGDSISTSSLRHAIAGLRRDISTMIRLVDACSAFHRGMWLRRGVALPAYDASGKSIEGPELRPAQGLVG